MDKNIVRKEYKRKRDNQKLEDKNRKEKIILDKLFNFNKFIKSENIFIYMSFLSEVDTYFIIEKLLKLNKNIYVPKIIDNNMYAVKYHNEVKKNKFGIYEPVDTEPLNNEYSKKIDVAIIPLLAFDEHMNRLGYGKGFYDRFLMKNDCIKIGIAFDIQKAEKIPNEITDISLDYIITDEKIYRKEKPNGNI